MSNDISEQNKIISWHIGDIFHGMAKRKETLSAYITRVVEEESKASGKKFTYKDIALGSRGQISAQYVSDLVSGVAANPTVDKVKHLAKGLRRAEEEVFAVARGVDLAAEELQLIRVKALLNKVDELGDEDRQWFQENLAMLDREIDTRLRKRSKDK